MSVDVGRRPSSLRVLGSVVVAAGAAALVVRLPASGGSSWAEVGQIVSGVPTAVLVGLALLWLAGLVASSVGLAACLPGLGVRRALALSLGGSAAANLLPLGGAAGVGVNYALARSWGYRGSDFARYTVVTNLFDVTSKVVVVVVAGAVVLASGRGVLPGALAATSLAVAGLVLVGAALLLRVPAATTVGRWLDGAALRLGHLVRRQPRPGLQVRLPALAASSVALLRRAWPQIVAGSGGYAVLQALLLAACLRSCGLHADPALVAALFATDRLVTLLPITPGGVGLVETVLSATVVAWGAPAAPGVAGILLYRALTYAAEVPLGGAVLLGWLLSHIARRQRLDVAREPGPEAAG